MVNQPTTNDHKFKPMNWIITIKSQICCVILKQRMINDVSDDSDPVSWFEKAAAQILFVETLIDGDELKTRFQKLCIDRPECRDIANRPLPEIFRKLNVKLRNYSMEIKSVAIKTDGIIRYFHGIANTEVNDCGGIVMQT